MTDLQVPQAPAVVPAPVHISEIPAPAPKIKSRSLFPKKLVILPVLVVAVLVVGLIVKSLPDTSLVPDSSSSLVWWGLDMDPQVAQVLIEKYKADHPGVEIKYEKQSKQDYRERLSNALARGAGPDIMAIHNSWVPMFKSELDVAPSAIFAADEFSKTFFPAATDDLSSGKGMYGVPLGFDGIGMYVNLDIFARYKQEIPLTWDDFKEVAPIMTARDKVGNITQSGAAIGNYTNVDHWPEILTLLMLQDGVRLSKIEDPLVMNALTFYNKFGDPKNGSWDPTLPKSTLAFADNKTAIYFAPSYRISEIRNINKSLNFRIYSVPQVVEDPLIKRPRVAYATYWVQSVWKRSRAKGISWDFLKFLSEKETLKLMHTTAKEKGLFMTSYPRMDMEEDAKAEVETYGLWSTAPIAKSWYIATDTQDGTTGINSQLVHVFEKDFGGGVKLKQETFLSTLAADVGNVLSQYKISAK